MSFCNRWYEQVKKRAKSSGRKSVLSKKGFFLLEATKSFRVWDPKCCPEKCSKPEASPSYLWWDERSDLHRLCSAAASFLSYCDSPKR